MIWDLVRIDLFYPGKMGGEAYEAYPDLTLEELEPFKDLIRSEGFRVRYRLHRGLIMLLACQGGDHPERMVTPGYQVSSRSEDSVSVTKYYPGRVPEHAYRWLE